MNNRQNLMENIAKFGNKNSNYVPEDGVVSYPIESMDFVRTGFLKICPTLSARDYKDPKRVLIRIGGGQMYSGLENNQEPECINLYKDDGTETSFQERVYRADKVTPAITTSFRPSYLVENCVIGSLQEHTAVKNDGVCTSLTAAMGMGGGQTPMVVEKEKMENQDKILIKQATVDGSIECNVPGIADLSYPSSPTSRGRVQDGGDTSPTLTTSPEGLTVIETRYRIRKLTPRECWRLMGFTDADYEAAEKVNSNSQLYKQAGNSIVKNVLMAIFSQMNIKNTKNWKENV